PLTSSGKLDRNALPAPDGSSLTSGVEYAAPRDDLECELCALFKKVLGVPRVGLDDSFPELGGHSLQAIRLITAANATLGVEIGFTELNTLKVREICDNINKNHPKGKSTGLDFADVSSIQYDEKIKKTGDFIHLEFEISPLFRHHNSQALQFGFLEKKCPCINEVYDNFFVQWVLRPEISIGTIAQYPYVDEVFPSRMINLYRTREEVTMSAFDSSLCSKTMKEALNRGEYLQLLVDDYFIETRHDYRIQHSIHDINVFGYDYDYDKFVCSLQTARGDYTAFYIENEVLLEAIAGAVRILLEADDKEDLVPLGAVEMFKGRTDEVIVKSFRVNEEANISLDIPLIIDHLRAYLSGNLRTIRINGSIEDYDWARVEAGIKVYDGLVGLIKSFPGDVKGLPLNSFRFFWEHKRCMRRRMDRLSVGILGASGLSRRFAEIEHMAEELFFLFVDASETGRLSVERICELIRKIRDLERDAIETFLGKVTSLPEYK
ncbi:phosphopantetheine-binding protein, partial [Pelagicoccus sp. SDUM812002]|uniref:phosphopantetheine-binding protein n=1 Tax=Pelagicoccus sp. SDUM812002 TaxID=3041266 RepID=UPI00280EF43F